MHKLVFTALTALVAVSMLLVAGVAYGKGREVRRSGGSWTARVSTG